MGHHYSLKKPDLKKRIRDYFKLSGGEYSNEDLYHSMIDYFYNKNDFSYWNKIIQYESIVYDYAYESCDFEKTSNPLMDMITMIKCLKLDPDEVYIYDEEMDLAKEKIQRLRKRAVMLPVELKRKFEKTASEFEQYLKDYEER